MSKVRILEPFYIGYPIEFSIVAKGDEFVDVSDIQNFKLYARRLSNMYEFTIMNEGDGVYKATISDTHGMKSGEYSIQADFDVNGKKIPTNIGTFELSHGVK